MSKVVIAKYTTYAVFKLPKGYDPEQLMKDNKMYVRWNTLHIVDGEKDVEVEEIHNAQEDMDWKRPDELTVEDADCWLSQAELDDDDDDDDDEDKEKEICLVYSQFIENFGPKKDYSKIQEDDTIIIQTRPAESKNESRQKSKEWCAFEWKHESEETWKLWEYKNSSPFAMWWCNQDED